MDVSTMTVEQVAQRWAPALAVFNRHGIDICCGGAKTVREAARLHDLALESLLAELSSAGVPVAAQPAKS